MFEVVAVAAAVSIVGGLLASRIGGRRAGSRESRAGGPGVIYYRTNDGSTDYAFRFEQHGGSYRVYLVDTPSYGTRDADAHSTHRLTDERGRKYICWAGPIASEEQARQVASLWAEKTQQYIKTGARF